MKKGSVLNIFLVSVLGLTLPMYARDGEGRGSSEGRSGGVPATNRSPSMSRARTSPAQASSRPSPPPARATSSPARSSPAPQMGRPPAAPSRMAMPTQSSRRAPPIQRPAPTSEVKGRPSQPLPLSRGRISAANAAPIFSRRINARPNFPQGSQARMQQFFRASQGRSFDPQILHQRQRAFQNNRFISPFKQVGNRTRASFFHNRPGARFWFRGDFFRRHRLYSPFFVSPVNWWSPTPWGQVNNWLSWNVTSPTYYDGGYPITIPEDYRTPAAGYPIEPAQADWLPLGVFAIGKTADSLSNSNMYFQLALGKNGEIAGAYYNAGTDQAYEVQGATDQISQQAAWTLVDNPNSPIMSTGLYNLTQGETEVSLSFPTGATENWLMVRL